MDVRMTSLRGRGSPHYGSGRSFSSAYVRIWCPGHPMANSDGYALEHRLVLFEAGIEIPDGYHVHHKNEDKHDNRIENLEVLPATDHRRLHVEQAGEIVNQYGTFPVLRGEAKTARRRELLNTYKERRFRRLAADPSIQPHGVINTYQNWGCRCALCMEACRDATRSRRQARGDRS